MKLEQLGLRWATTAMLFLGLATTAHAQQVGVMEKPCSVIAPQPDIVADYFKSVTAAKANNRPSPVPSAAEMKAYNEWKEELRSTDFFGLCRYQEANDLLPEVSSRRIVFFGDSITELWEHDTPEFFANGVLNRGISGQTTQQMLGRFRSDVIELNPAVVQIMAGTNDIAGNTGPTSLPWIQANISSMVELAKAHDIEVILAAIPPAARFGWRPEIAPTKTIAAYNDWLRNYAAKHQLVFIDYHALLDNELGGIKQGLSNDDVHPNSAGYALMTKQAQAAIDSMVW